MFDKQYTFRGTHADKVIKLTANFDGNNKLFARNLDVYLTAPIVGFLYQKTALLDKADGKTDIFPEQLINNKDDLWFNYRLVMLLDKKHEPSLDKRIDKAFRLPGTPEAAVDEERFEEYVRGGVELLYEKLIETAKNPDDYIKNLYDFMEDFDSRYNENVSTEGILDLCRLAKS